MIRSRLLLAALALTVSRPLHAMPACPSDWSVRFSAPAERWPDVERVNNPHLLHDMARELYEHCPRNEANDALLTSAAEKFLRLSARKPDLEPARQEAHFWLGMVYAFHAGAYDRDNRKADSALSNFIALDDLELRRQAGPEVQALRLRSARQWASLARYTQLNAQNLGKAGWNGASQRVRCFLNAYPDMTGDEEVRGHLTRLTGRARDFIHDYAQDSRYDLAGMNILATELENSLRSPAAPSGRWPTEADIDPANPADPANCYLRPSPIPGPEKFDFDFSIKGDEHRKAAAKKARARAQAVLDGTLP